MSFVSQARILNKIALIEKHGFHLPENLTGLKFGRLLVLKMTHKNYRRPLTETVFKCRCDCGKIVWKTRKSLVHCKTRSCGCLLYAIYFSRGTHINPEDVPFDVIRCLQARGELKKAIKEAS